jgi:hypothetical protein
MMAGISKSWRMIPGMALRNPPARKAFAVKAVFSMESNTVCAPPQAARPSSIAGTRAR